MKKRAFIFWRRQARWTAFRYNLSWWLSYFLSAAVALSAVFACMILTLRHWDSFSAAVWYGFIGALIVAAGWAWWRAANQFFTTRDGFVRLDDQMKLNNQLTAADAALTDFPSQRPVSDGFRWRWSRILVPIIGVGAVLLVSAFIPMKRSINEILPVDQPPAWVDVAAWEEELEKSEVMEKIPLDRLREQLAELREQPQNEWYNQSSLEAGDALREQTAQSVDALRRNLQTATNALAAAQSLAEMPASTSTDALQQKLTVAIDGLEMGNLPLNRDLLNQLKTIDLSKLKTIDPKQISQLRDALKKGLKACAMCNGIGNSEEGGNALLSGTQPGQGGIARGPGAAPLSFNPLPTDLGTKHMEGITSEDMSRALPGEVISVQRSEPQPDTKPPAMSTESAGEISSTGSGGETVWRNDLTPQEREVLKRFFK